MVDANALCAGTIKEKAEILLSGLNNLQAIERATPDLAIQHIRIFIDLLEKEAGDLVETLEKLE
jgi:hypothetical protein